MSEVKRYMHSDQRGSVEVVRGKYVLYEDYVELKAQRDELEDKLARSQDWSMGVDSERMEYIEKCNMLADENAALKSAILIAKDGLQEHYDTDGVDSQDSEGNFTDACIRLCDAQSTIEKLEDILTPATAAYLKSLRAEGVDDLATFAGEQYQQHAGDKSQQKKWKSVVFLCTQFAAQLRAGKDGE